MPNPTAASFEAWYERMSPNVVRAVFALTGDAGFAAELAGAAEHLGIPVLAVEKDYWVTRALRGMAAAHPAGFIFKGGTSLTKGSRVVVTHDPYPLRRGRSRQGGRPFARYRLATAVEGDRVGVADLPHPIVDEPGRG